MPLPDHLNTVLEIATNCREACEEYQYRHEAFADDLCGMCAVASCFLYRELKKHGIKVTIAENEEHCFLLYRGWIIDITATQFGFRRVFIERWQEYRDMYAYRVKRRFRSLKSYISYQSRVWDRSQKWVTHREGLS